MKFVKLSFSVSVSFRSMIVKIVLITSISKQITSQNYKGKQDVMLIQNEWLYEHDCK